MPGNDARHGPQFRRALTKTITTAAAAIGILALAACTSTSTTTSPPVPAVRKESRRAAVVISHQAAR